MCQIVEDYAQEKADFQRALDIVELIDNAMRNGEMSLKDTCKLVGVSQRAYKDAKKLLSAIKKYTDTDNDPNLAYVKSEKG